MTMTIPLAFVNLCQTVIAKPLRLVHHTLSRLLPFTNPQTPFWQDVIHLIALGAALYLAPDVLTDENLVRLRQFWRRSQTQAPVPTLTQDASSGVGEVTLPHSSSPEVIENERITTDLVNSRVQADYLYALQLQMEQDAEDNSNGAAAVVAATVAAEAANDEYRPESSGQGQRHRERLITPLEAVPGGSNVTASKGAVGAKKAKSIARKEARRAYNEFLRTRSEMQRRDEDLMIQRINQDRVARENLLLDGEGSSRDGARLSESVEYRRQQEKWERQASKAIMRANVEAINRRAREFLNETRNTCGIASISLTELAQDASCDTATLDMGCIRSILKRSDILGRLVPGGENCGMTSEGEESCVMITRNDQLVRISRTAMEEIYAGINERINATGYIDSDNVVQLVNGIARFVRTCTA